MHIALVLKVSLGVAWEAFKCRMRKELLNRSGEVFLVRRHPKRMTILVKLWTEEQ